MEITVIPEEHAAESLTDAHLKQALDAIRTEGYIILNAVVAHEHLDLLRERMTEDIEKIMNAPVPVVSWHTKTTFCTQVLRHRHRAMTRLMYTAPKARRTRRLNHGAKIALAALADLASIPA